MTTTEPAEIRMVKSNTEENNILDAETSLRKQMNYRKENSAITTCNEDRDDNIVMEQEIVFDR